MDVTTLTTQQLKAIGYDELRAIERSRNNVAMIENELERRAAGDNAAGEPATQEPGKTSPHVS